MSIDLRNVFDNILRQWGHDVFLHRVVNPKAPYDVPRYAQNSEGAPVLERHTTRHTYPGSRALGSIAQEEIEGVLHDYEYIYYFRHNVEPRSGDRIYDELGERDGGDVMYTVDMAIPMRGRGGRIEFWAAGVTSDQYENAY